MQGNKVIRLRSRICNKVSLTFGYRVKNHVSSYSLFRTLNKMRMPLFNNFPRIGCCQKFSYVTLRESVRCLQSCCRIWTRRSASSRSTPTSPSKSWIGPSSLPGSMFATTKTRKTAWLRQWLSPSSWPHLALSTSISTGLNSLGSTLQKRTKRHSERHFELIYRCRKAS